jgi:hypothetical protein
METARWRSKPTWAASCSSKQFVVKFGDGIAERVLDPEMDARLSSKLTDFWPGRRSGFPGPLAVSLLRKDLPTLSSNDYHILSKTDGNRFMMVTSFSDGKFVFDMLNRAGEHYLVTNIQLKRKLFETGCVFDGELVQVSRSGKLVHEFMIFDCAYALGVNMREECYTKRLETARHIIEENYKPLPNDPFRIVVKNTMSINEAIEMLYEGKHRVGQDPNDGIILVCENMPYVGGKDEFLFKYKNLEDHTVDFLANNDDNSDKVDLFVIENNAMTHVQSIILTESDLDNLGISSIRALKKVVVECKFTIEKEWVPIRRRVDKDIPNNRFTYERTCDNICENILPKEVYIALKNKQV